MIKFTSISQIILRTTIGILYLTSHGVMAQTDAQNKNSIKNEHKERDLVKEAMQQMKEASQISEVTLQVSPNRQNAEGATIPSMLLIGGICSTKNRASLSEIVKILQNAGIQKRQTGETQEPTIQNAGDFLTLRTVNESTLSFQFEHKNISQLHASGIVDLNGFSNLFISENKLSQEIYRWAGQLVERGECENFSTNGRQ